MKQVLIRKGNVLVENVPAPRVEPGHILVEVAYSLISTGTELSSVQSSGQSLFKKAWEQPEKVKRFLTILHEQGIKKTITKVNSQLEQARPTGYSCSGIVIQVGDGVRDLRVGDRVACAGAGIANHAEIVLVPRNLVVKVPDACDLKDVASVTLGAIAMQGVRRADPRLGEIVAVTGLGLLGMITVQLLKAAGCRVIGYDMDPRRVKIAQQLGADYAFLPSEVDMQAEVRHLTDGYGVDAVIITAASDSNAIVQQAMEITRKKGKVVVVGAVGLGLNRSPFYEKEIDFLISSSYGPGRYDPQYEKKGLDYPYAYTRWTENRNMQAYLSLISEGKVQLGPVMEKEYELSEASEAFLDLQKAGEKPLGTLLCYPSVADSDHLQKLTTKVELEPRQINGKIRIAIIGAGNFAKETHLPNLQIQSDAYQIRAIVSNTGSNAKAAAELFHANYASTDYHDVLNDPEMDAVLICTPHHLHAGMTLEALRAGKHVLVEKPLALTKNDVDAIQTFYANHASMPVLLTGFNRRFSPHIQYIKKFVDQRTDPMIINYRMNAGYLPLDHWVHSAEGGGRNIGEACHIYDLFTFLTNARVLEVSTQSIHPKTGYYTSKDNFICMVSFEDGSLATLTYTALGNPAFSKEQMDVYVDGKILALNNYQNVSVFGSGEKGLKTSRMDKGLAEELRLFALAIKGEKPWPNPLWQQVQAMEIAFAVEQSLQRE